MLKNKDLHRVIGLGLPLFFLSACQLLNSSAQKSKNQGPGSPSNAAEALQSLSEADQQTLNTWANKLIKTCNANDVFESDTSLQSKNSAVDYEKLLNITNQSHAVFGNSGELVLFDNPREPKLEKSTLLSRKNTLQGKTESIETEFRQTGSICEVFVYGQLVQKIHLVENLEIDVFFQENRADKPLFIQPTFELTTNENKNFIEIQKHGLENLFISSFRPNSKALQILAEKLNLPLEMVSKHFILNRSPQPLFSFQFKESSKTRDTPQSSLIWNTPYSDSILAENSFVSSLYGKSVQYTSLQLRLRTNKKESPLYYDFEVTLETQPLKQPENSYQLKIHSMEFNGVKNLQLQTLKICLINRIHAYAALNVGKNSLRTFQEISGPCNALSSQFKNSIFSDATFTSLVFKKIFESYTPTQESFLGDWDAEFVQALMENPSLNHDQESLKSLELELERWEELLPYKSELIKLILFFELRGKPFPYAKIISTIENMKIIHQNNPKGMAKFFQLQRELH